MISVVFLKKSLLFAIFVTENDTHFRIISYLCIWI